MADKMSKAIFRRFWTNDMEKPATTAVSINKGADSKQDLCHDSCRWNLCHDSLLALKKTPKSKTMPYPKGASATAPQAGRNERP
jgi:hypothetical protein